MNRCVDFWGTQELVWSFWISERATKANISSTVINCKDYIAREAFDKALHNELIKHNVEIICLVGFMRILTPGFVNKWKGKLPKFMGFMVQKDT